MFPLHDWEMKLKAGPGKKTIKNNFILKDKLSSRDVAFQETSH